MYLVSQKTPERHPITDDVIDVTSNESDDDEAVGPLTIPVTPQPQAAPRSSSTTSKASKRASIQELKAEERLLFLKKINKRFRDKDEDNDFRAPEQQRRRHTASTMEITIEKLAREVA